MPTCRTCNVNKPQQEFYKIRQKAGNITYRKECKECFSNKESSRYHIKVGRKGRYRLAYCTSCSEWKIKSQYFSFDLNKCNGCIKNELETIVEPEKEIVEEYTIEDESPEFEEEELQPDPLYIKCRICGIEKLRKDYYPRNKATCKACCIERRINQSISANQGTRWMVPSEVGNYECEEQFEELSKVMISMGWKYEDNGSNKQNGTWYKPGYKDKDKNFYIDGRIIHNSEVKPKRKGINIKAGTSKLDPYKQEIISYIQSGYTFFDVADIYNCSHTTIRHFFKKNMDEKK